MINENAEKTKIVAEEAEAEKLAIEARKAERTIKLEADKVAQKEADRVNHERQIELEKRRAADRAKWKAEEEEVERLDAIRREEKRVEEAKAVIPSPSKVVEEIKVTATETYTVTGTEAQLDALEVYLNANVYGWI